MRWRCGTAAGLFVSLIVGCNSGETGRLKGITDAHNAVRAAVDGPAPDPALPELEWSDDLADVAQDWADELADRGCELVHSNGK